MAELFLSLQESEPQRRPIMEILKLAHFVWCMASPETVDEVASVDSVYIKQIMMLSK